MPTTYCKAVNECPYIAEGVSWTTHYSILSNFIPTQKTDYDVMTSFTVIPPKIACITLLFMLLIFLLIHGFHKMMPDVSGYAMNQVKLLWDIATSLSFQFNFDSDVALSLKIILVSFSMMIFWVAQYYNGYFSTDLIVQEKAEKVDSLEDLVNSTKYPLWFLANPVVEEFNSRHNDIYGEVWKKHLKQVKREGVAFDDILKFEPGNVGTHLQRIQHHEGALILSMLMEAGIKAMYCMGIDDIEDSTIHESDTKFSESVYTSLMGRQIRPELRSTLTLAWSHLFEANIFNQWWLKQTDLIVIGIVDKIDLKLRQCLTELKNTDQDVESIIWRVRNVRLVFVYSGGGFVIALIFLILELIKRLVKKLVRTRRRKKLRTELERRRFSIRNSWRIQTTNHYDQKLSGYARRQSILNSSNRTSNFTIT